MAAPSGGDADGRAHQATRAGSRGGGLGAIILPPMSSAVDLDSFERALADDINRRRLRFRAPRLDPFAVYADRADEGCDLRQIASEGLMRLYAKLGQLYAGRVPPWLDLPSRRALGLADLPAGRWDWNSFHRGKLVRVLARYGPMEQVERLFDSGNQALRNHWRADRAQKRQASGSLDDIDELIVGGKEGRFLNPSGAAPERPGLEAKLDLKRVEERVVGIIEHRHGGNAARAAAALLGGKTPEEAAAAVGVSERQVRRYQKRLQEILHQLQKKMSKI
jgi:hypothetical protein